LVVAAFCAAIASAASAELSPRQRAEDFDAMWRAVDSGYAYFDGARAAWRRARETWRPRALRTTSHADFAAALHGAISELHDDHASVSERSAPLPRRIPFDVDIWARWKDGSAVIEAVRTFGDADVAGLHAGQVVTRLDGIPVERAVRERLGDSRSGPAARDWALRQVLAGPRNGIQRIEVRDGARTTTREIERAEAKHSNGPAIVGRRMGDERDIGYIRVRVGSADPDLVAHFDGALHYLMDTRALILDLRENAGPGSREVTRAILARFVAAPAPWQVRAPVGKPRIADTVAPRGEAPYRPQMAVLVDRWTAGEGEALAAGLNAVAKATLVGTPMAGLRGELRELTLRHSGIVVRFPAEKSYHVDGTPREALLPAVPVDLAAPSGGPGDPILYQALKLLAK
jgi:C-terminal processing protease CtpA/Prc